MKKSYFIALALFVSSQYVDAQAPLPKFSIHGGARAVYFADRLALNGDTTTLPRENSGHVLADLGVSVRPNTATEVLAMVRIRNDYGGFWGSGVSFDVRQLTVKGLIQNRFKYTVGDMDYALTPYTMFRTAPLLELLNGMPALQTLQQNMPGNDVFMNANGSWRTQGASLDFGLQFRNGPSSLNNSLFAMRLRPGFGGAATEQWAYGGRTELKWQDFPLRIGGTLVAVRDMPGSSAQTNLYQSTVMSTDGDFGNGLLRLHWEAGTSMARFADTAQTEKTDFFYALKLHIGKNWQVAYREVGPDFFSPAAQTTAYNPTSVPRSFRTVGNDRALRAASIYDFSREAGLYRTAWSTTLGNDQSDYLLLDPFGEATPNRRGLTAAWQKDEILQGLSVGVKADLFSEIRGSGTSELTRFSRAELNLTYVFRNSDLKLMYRDQRSWRQSTNAEVPDLSVNQPWWSVNVGHQFSDAFRLDASLLQVQSRGFVFDAVRNAQNEIIDFNGRTLDYSELLPVVAVSYKAFGKSTLQLGLMASNISESGNNMNIRSGFLAYFIQF